VLSLSLWPVKGANVAVAGIGDDSIDTTMGELKEIGRKTLGLIWDLADLSAIDANITKIESDLGAVDILINNTGGPPPTAATGVDPALWAKQFQAMVLSVIAITDRVLPRMKARGWGRVLTSTSSGVISPIANLAHHMALHWSASRYSHSANKRYMKLTSLIR
jgi:3-oxoacyl-[acyl-carrier protein] reductase